MPRHPKHQGDRPATPGDLIGDPYRGLIAGIVEGAMQDAQGRLAPLTLARATNSRRKQKRG